MPYCIALGEEMGKFLYRSINRLPSGRPYIRFTTNPEDAKKFGGVLTCRLVKNFNPIKQLKLNRRPDASIPPIQ